MVQLRINEFLENETQLNVWRIFFLKVLDSSPKSVEAKDIMDLLQIAVDYAVDFGNKTYINLKNMSKDKKLKSVIQEGMPAYIKV